MTRGQRCSGAARGHCPAAWLMLPQGREQEDLTAVGVMRERKSSPWERGWGCMCRH